MPLKTKNDYDEDRKEARIVIEGVCMITDEIETHMHTRAYQG
jgi:hypothetical protein